MLGREGIWALTETKEAEGQNGNDMQVESLRSVLC